MAPETADDKNSFHFYVTAGRGTESFVADEIKDELLPVNISTRDGKVFLRVLHVHYFNVEKILALKSAERAFVAIADYDNSIFVQNKRTFLDKLMQVLSCGENFKLAKTALKQLTSLIGDVQMREQRSPQHDNASIIQGSSADGLGSTCIQKVPLGNNKMESRAVISRHESDEFQKNRDEPAMKVRRSEGQGNDNFISEDNRQHINVINQAKCDDRAAFDASDQTCQLHCGKDDVTLSFRMSIKCSGKAKKWLDLKKLSRDLGWRVAKASGWRVDLRKPQIEVCVHISDEYVTVGVPLTKFPLSKRNYVMDPGLRAPIAWIMYKLANIKTGDVVLDPLCGKATILLEACSNVQTAYYLGSDKDSSQIITAAQNISMSNMGKSVSLVTANSLYMPYRDGCIDVIVTDAPFNQKHMTCDTPKSFYKNLLMEIHRVLRPCGRCVLLTSLEMKDMVLSMVLSTTLSREGVGQSTSTETVDALASENKSGHSDARDKCLGQREEAVPLTSVSSHYVKLGETHAFIIVFNKS